MNMIEQAQSLGAENIGIWPMPLRLAILVVAVVAVLAAGFYFDTRVRREELADSKSEETNLWNSFEGKQRQAASLEPLRQQLAEMKESFGALLRQLPNETEIEALVVDISQAGLSAGLEFELFRPQAEQTEEFIAVLPIQMRASGTYAELGEFISSVAALPRIVTQHNISLQPRGGGPVTTSAQELTVDLLARTYRYLDDEAAQ